MTEAECNKPEDEEKVNLATTKQKIWLAAMLVVSALILTYCWITLVTMVEDSLQRETRVTWDPAIEVVLVSELTAFHIDRENKQLVFVGPIDKSTKGQLIALIDSKDPDKRALIPSYQMAIDQLTFNANVALRGFVVTMLLLGGISGVLGVQLRSMINFVGNACFKDRLDIVRWWPWYVLRPVYGFILGMVVVLLIRVGLFSASGNLPSTDTLSLVAIAVLAGFGADEFTQRLRSLSQTIFGQSK